MGLWLAVPEIGDDGGKILLAKQPSVQNQLQVLEASQNRELSEAASSLLRRLNSID